MSDSLKSLANSKFLLAQKVRRYVESEDFENATKVASYEQLQLIKIKIEAADIIGLKNLCEHLAFEEKEREEQNVRALRLIARGLGIMDYQSMNKSSLLSAIARKEKEKQYD